MLALGSWLGHTGEATATRMALLVGNDDGQAPDARLRYAQRDAARMAELLGRVGGFSRDEVVVLAGRTDVDVRRALAELAARLRATPGEHVALVFYSGHADGQSLHLGAASLPMAELRAAVAALPAAVRVLIVDACQAGIVTRAKGGAAGVGFEPALQPVERTRGLAILAASTASEVAQESDELGGAVFTHYLHAGLAGLADNDGDGEVSLGEAFDYAANRTLVATMGTRSGPQHPTFRLDLEGSQDLILTRPGVGGAGYGHVRLDVPGWYFIRRADGTVAAEVVSRGGDALVLDAGPYEVTRRGNGSLQVAELRVGEGTAMLISAVPSRSVAFGRLVRKGGGAELAYGLAAALTARTPLADLGTTVGVGLTARADLEVWSLELRLGLGRAHAGAARLSSTTSDSTVSVAALRVHDFAAPARGPSLAAAIGLEVGLAYLAQTLDSGARHVSFSPFVGPTAVGELALGRRYFLRSSLSVPLYALRVEGGAPASDASSATLWRLAVAAALGGGAWF
jgi:hypothetical protein